MNVNEQLEESQTLAQDGEIEMWSDTITDLEIVQDDSAVALDLQPRFLKFIHFYLHPSFKSLITVQNKKKKTTK